MTHTIISPDTEVRETRTPVRVPDRKAAGLFPGWGPKF